MCDGYVVIRRMFIRKTCFVHFEVHLGDQDVLDHLRIMLHLYWDTNTEKAMPIGILIV